MEKKNKAKDLLSESRYIRLLEEKQEREKNRPKPIPKEVKDKRTKQWCTFYRRNLNVYIEERLRIHLTPFQHIMIYLMSNSQVFWAICSRGLTKTFIVGLFCLAYALTHPNAEIGIVASTIEQANKIVDAKIKREMIDKLSPVLKWMSDEGLIVITHPKDCAQVDIFNGSWIKVMPALDSARGERLCIVVAEEARLIKKRIWDSVFTKMLRPRRATFIDLDEYQGNPLYLEEGKEIYITSAYFKTHWIWSSFKKCVNGCYNNKGVEYNFFAGDIFTAIKHGFKTLTDLRKAKQDSGELEFRMEDLNEMIGEGADAYFTLEMFQKNQILTKAFRPSTASEFAAGVDFKNRKKKESEYRILAVDLAFTGNAEGKKEESDRCAIEIITVHCKENGDVVRKLEYIDSLDGANDRLVKQTIRELFFDFEIDFIVFDSNGGGEQYFNDLSTPFEHPERGSNWNSHGFGLYEDKDFQVLSEGVLNDLRNRTVDPQPIPCLIPIKAHGELNSNMWKSLWKVLNNGTLLLLEDELQVENKMDDPKMVMWSSEEKMLYKNPFLQTSRLINEGINLSQSWRNGVLTLTEPRSGHKDRMSALQYGNYIADKIENKYAIKNYQDNGTSTDYLGNLVW